MAGDPSTRSQLSSSSGRDVAVDYLLEEQNRVVELRYFGGLMIAGISEMLGIAEAMLSRRWQTARL
jgi:DNA-directed RNA polymerase specialized sigma24 family protein